MNKKKNISNKPKFNSYWIYASILVFFASTYFMGGDGNTSASKKINISSSDLQFLPIEAYCNYEDTNFNK